jgi:hypothetical protein
MHSRRRKAFVARAYVLAVILFMLFVASPVHSTDRANETVYFNVQNHKVHKMSCVWGQRCTKHCIVIKRAEAYRRGGIPCKVCGG